MRVLPVTLALALWASTSAQALACTPPMDPQYPNQSGDYLRFARAIYAEARYVEIVEAVSAVPVAAPEAWDRWLNIQGGPGFADKASARVAYEANRHKPVGVVFRLAVVERLKGRGLKEIVLEGGGVAAPTSHFDDEEFRHLIRKGRPQPILYAQGVDELNLPDGLIARNSCSPHQLHLAIGQRYLIFRGRDGRLLRTTSGYRVVALGSGVGAGHWLEAVRRVAR